MQASEYSAMAAVEQRHWWFRGRLAVVRAYLRRFVPPGRGLDCSCGTGMTLSELSPWVQTGADLEALALQHSHARGHTQLLRADLTRLPIADASFDVVTSLDTLEHIEDDAAALAEIARVLRPGGYALLTVPAHPWMFSAHDRALHHVRRYRRGEFRDKIARSGLQLRKLRYINVGLFPLVAAVRVLRPDKGDSRSDTTGVPPAPINALLKATFASEALFTWLPSIWGVSLLAVVQRP
jgi:SAM-dependent methyltransferase